MKTGACESAANGKNDGGIRRPRGFPAVPHRPPLRWDGGEETGALHAPITKHGLPHLAVDRDVEWVRQLLDGRVSAARQDLIF